MNDNTIFPHSIVLKSIKLDVPMISKFSNIPMHKGINIVNIAPKYFPKITPNRDTEFAIINLNAPDSHSPDIAS